MKTYRFDRRCVVVALFALTLAAQGIIYPLGSNAASPDLHLRPNDGPAGSLTEARGRDFAPGATGTLIWVDDESTLGEFTADDSGDFSVSVAIPSAPVGIYTMEARAETERATDTYEITESETPATPTTDASPVVLTQPADTIANNDCENDANRVIDVADTAGLTEALANATPGDRIDLADGVYPGTFVVATSGNESARIALCGTAKAIIDGGDFGNGYALHVTGDYWTISGITVTNALKGIMLDDADFTVIDDVTVHQIGHEGVHFRTNSSDNLIQNSRVYDTGLKRDKFGEGIYIGSAVSNWPSVTNGDEDRSDRNAVLSNQIWNTTSESIDIKEGTTGGLIDGNVFDGSRLSGADSWVDVKGIAYLIRNNHGTNSPKDGFQTHVINDLPWGQDNVFEANSAEVNGAGFGFYIHNPDASHNTVRCDNVVRGVEAGFANQECTQ